MRGTVGAVLLLTLGAWVGASDGPPPKKKNPIPVAIIGIEQGKIWGHTIIQPLMSFRVTSGKPPEKGTVQLCTIITNKTRENDGPNVRWYNTLSLHCEEGLVMELEGIDLEGGQ